MAPKAPLENFQGQSAKKLISKNIVKVDPLGRQGAKLPGDVRFPNTQLIAIFIEILERFHGIFHGGVPMLEEPNA